MLRRTLSLGLNSSFIEVYDNALSQKDCDILINQFEKSEIVEGCTEIGYHPELKKCLQLDNPQFSDQNPISNIVKPVLMGCLAKYYNKYRDVLGITPRWKIDTGYSYQKYEREDDGYKAWHCEHGPSDISYKRIMVWMFYLNDAKCGTEFMHYSSINAKRGRCVMWPAFWTHHHRGITPNKGVKYIVTGWISFVD